MFKEMNNEKMMKVDGGRTADDGARLTTMGKIRRAQRKLTGNLDTIGSKFNIKIATDEIREAISFFTNF